MGTHNKQTYINQILTSAKENKSDVIDGDWHAVKEHLSEEVTLELNFN